MENNNSLYAEPRNLGKRDSVTYNIFSGGEVDISIPFLGAESVAVTAFIRNSEELLALCNLTNAFEQDGVSISDSTLTIPYAPYARQDRVCNQGEANGCQVFAKIINSLGYKRVIILDPHSDVLPSLINNCEIKSPDRVILKIPDLNTYTFVSPDAGAEKKVTKLVDNIKEKHKPVWFKGDVKGVIQCYKRRNPLTGEILSSTIINPDFDPGRYFLILDDICDGGRTFISLAKQLRIKFGNSINIGLYTTHGIFSYGLQPLVGSIQNVYYSNSLNQDGSGIYNRLNSKALIQK